MAFGYRVAGLTLAANIRLPHVPPSSAPTSTDLVVCVGPPPAWALKPMSVQYTSPYTDERGVPAMRLVRAREGFSIEYSDGCLFWITTCGSRIWMTYESTLEDACTYLVGPVLSFALRLRGDFSLHASAIANQAGVVALAGRHGVGKSTAAAAFGRCGMPVVTDDILRITQSASGWLAHPVGGILRLWPEGESAVFGESDRLDRITPNWDKRALTIGKGGVPAAERAMPLAGVVFLSPDEAATSVRLTPLSPAEAAVRLAENSSAAHLIDGAARTREFQQVAAIASSVPCAVLTRPLAAASLDGTLSTLKLWMERLPAATVVTG